MQKFADVLKRRERKEQGAFGEEASELLGARSGIFVGTDGAMRRKGCGIAGRRLGKASTCSWSTTQERASSQATGKPCVGLTRIRRLSF